MPISCTELCIAQLRKKLLPVYNRPVIEHVVKEAIAAGITEIILVDPVTVHAPPNPAGLGRYNLPLVF